MECRFEEGRMRPHDVFKQLRADHRHVLDELPELERAAGIGARRKSAPRASTLRRILQTLARQFDTHLAAEEEVLFPLLAQALPETLGRLEPLSLEHQELRGLLGSLSRLMKVPANAEREEQIAVQARDLVDLLRIHVRKEEALVFRLAERVLGPEQLNEVATRLANGPASPVRRARAATKGRRI
jgi:hemerythrin-like domain-containing protein